MKTTNTSIISLALFVCAAPLASAQDDQTSQLNADPIIESDTDESDSRIKRIRSIISADAQVEYLWSQEIDVDGGPGSLQAQQLNINTPIYFHKLSDNWGTTLGLQYTGTWLETDGIDNIASDDYFLSEIGIPVTFLGWTPSKDWFFIGRIAPTLGTDFESNLSDGIDFYAWGGAMYNFNDKLALGLGGYYSHRYGDDFLVGGVGFLYLINDQWSTGFVGPRYLVDYDHSENWHITAQVEAPGSQWRLNGNSAIGRDGLLDVDSYRVSLLSEHRISKTRDIFFTVRVGYQFAGELEARNAQDIVVANEDLEGGFYGGIGLRYYAW